jgi:alpha/beta superfamily hydrolase
VTVFPGCGHFFHGRLAQLQQVIAGMWQPFGKVRTGS